MKENKFLPIGSVVLLNGGTKSVMITGYLQKTEEKKDKVFDYRGCPFPEGVIESSGVALFDKDDINEVIHIGYENEEYDDFINKIDEIINGE